MWSSLVREGDGKIDSIVDSLLEYTNYRQEKQVQPKNQSIVLKKKMEFTKILEEQRKGRIWTFKWLDLATVYQSQCCKNVGEPVGTSVGTTVGFSSQ